MMRTIFSWHRYMWRMIHCVVSLFFIMVSALIALSLVTYHATDSSHFFWTSATQAVKNVLGAWGAECAALCIMTFGMSAYLIPCAFWMMSYCIASPRASTVQRDCCVALFLSIPLCSIFCFLLPIDYVTPWLPGGTMGFFGLWSLYYCCDLIGADALCAHACLIAGMSALCIVLISDFFLRLVKKIKSSFA